VPIDGHGAPAHDERDDQQVLVPCNGPVDGQPDWPMAGSWTSAWSSTASATWRGSRRALWSSRDKRLVAAS
jgi:hypothetical protein